MRPAIIVRVAVVVLLALSYGIGIDDDAAIVVTGDRFEVIGSGRVALYDNVRRDGSWYYWLNPGDRFDLRPRRKLER